MATDVQTGFVGDTYVTNEAFVAKLLLSQDVQLVDTIYHVPQLGKPKVYFVFDAEGSEPVVSLYEGNMPIPMDDVRIFLRVDTMYWQLLNSAKEKHFAQRRRRYGS